MTTATIPAIPLRELENRLVGLAASFIASEQVDTDTAVEMAAATLGLLPGVGFRDDEERAYHEAIVDEMVAAS